MAQPTSTSSANSVAWNLKDLYDGVDDPQITRDLESAYREMWARAEQGLAPQSFTADMAQP